MKFLTFAFLLAVAPGLLFAQVDVPTAQYDLSRTSSNMQETILNRANVNSAQFGKLFTRSVDAPFYASPLVITNYNVPGVGVRNLVYVATLGNSVYAFDADDPNAGAPYWSAYLGAPLSTGCCFLGPTIGILSTPVIDRSTNTIYLTAIVQSSDVGLYLYALDLGTGALKFNSPRRITYTFPSGVTKTDATSWLQRAALLLYGNVLYVGTSNVMEIDGDSKSQEGFIQTFKADDLSVQLASFETTPSGQGGAFWQAGRGLAVDSSGNVFAAIDSGAYDPANSFGSSVIKFSPGTLTPVDWFTPANWSFLYGGNLDETADGVTLIPGTTLAFTGGKAGIIYLLDQNQLGGLEPGSGNSPIQELPASHGCGTTDCGQYLPTAFWPHATNPFLYVWDAHDNLRAYPFDVDRHIFLHGNSMIGPLSQARAGGISVTSNGSADGTGIVWATTATQDPFFSAVPGTLRAYNANDITQELYDSDQNPCRDGMGAFVKMSTPIVANGKVYVNTHSNILPVYGLLPASGTVHVTVGPSVPGPIVTVDGGGSCAAHQSLDWPIGTTHSLATAPTQFGAAGTQFIWQNWSDGLPINHSVTASAATSEYTATFKTQYLVTTQVSPVGAGTISPATNFFDAHTQIELTATANSGSTTFAGFSGALVGMTNPAFLPVEGPLSVTANFQLAAGACPCTIWNSSAVPGTVDSGAGAGVELGVKFKSDVSGTITGIRFYKSAANTGTHVGNLWSSNGTLLATATFTSESPSGWQQVNFSPAVAVAANTVYVASYHTNVSHFSVDLNMFTSAGVDTPPLHALANGVSGGNGLYLYSGTSGFPTNTYNASNYWVDVVFSTAAASPLVSIAVSPSSPTINVGATQQFTATGTYQDSSTQDISAQVTWSSANTTAATINSAGLATGKAVGSSNITAALNSITSPSATLTVQAGSGSTCPCTIWPSSAIPSVVDSGAGGAVELGVKFKSDVSGTVTGIRFYKSAANTGTHVGNLWSSNGTLLATATFTSESASGWQQVNFSPAVAITANTVYVASYHTNVSHFSLDLNAFASSGVDTPPLCALSNGASGGNGLYLYSGTSGFPTNTYNASNYWVDVVFSTAAASPLVSIAVSPSSPTINVGATRQFTATGTYQDSSTQDISAQVTWSSANTTAATINSAGLATGKAVGSSNITAALNSITSNSATLTVQAGSGSTCPCTIWPSSAVPTVVDSGAGGAVELGVKFKSDVSGMVTGIRFYKSAANTGTHVGNLWSSNGTLLATATFTSESASGWQQVNFSPAVAVAANTVYVASYHTNVSHFSLDLNAFTSTGVDTPPLHALANGVSGGDGLYLYSGTSGFPTNTYNASNYWVDVVFSDTTPPPPTCPCTIWSNSAVPSIVDSGAGGAVELGVKFKSDVSGIITGIRFYKSAANTGTHIGNLWSSNGTLLATATFTGESASGWQQVNFTPAVAITANTVYVASYHTNVSHFSLDLNGFTSAGVDSPPLHALANGVSGANGLYLYSGTSGFPTNTYNASNYWVDAIFQLGFVSTGNMSVEREHLQLVPLSNGLVLAVDGSLSSSDHAELYNPATGTFTQTGIPTALRYFFTATLLNTGKVLIVGGSSSSVAVASAELYDPVTGVFTATGSMKMRRYDHTATLLGDGKVLIVGGRTDASSPLTSAELYDPVAGTFALAGDLKSARAEHTSTLLGDGTVLISGGQTSDGAFPASAELYNPTTASFGIAGNMKAPRMLQTATLLQNGLVLIAGGIDNSGTLASAELYNPATGLFAFTGNMSFARSFHTATLLNSGLVLVAGGIGSGGPVLNSAELYDPAAGIFTSAGTLKAPRQAHAATILSNGLVLLAGGTDSIIVESTAEIYAASN